MIKQLQTTRTCAACGQKKPLVAFLEMAEKDHFYGDICATCRGSSRGRKKVIEGESTQGSGGATRLQIDNETKVQLEREKKERQKQSSDRDYQEKIKKESTETAQANKSEQREKAEKKYREEFFQQKKQNAANPSKTEPPSLPVTHENHIKQTQHFYQEKTRITKELHTQVHEQQLGQKTTGITPDYIAKYVSSTGRSAESLFGQALGQLLRNHLQAKTTSQAPGPQRPNTEPKTAQQTPSSAKAQPTETSTAESKENIAVEFIKNNFKRR